MDELNHHGIKGMHWGVRRYQNEDGSLTPAGRKRLEKKDAKWAYKNHDKIVSKARKEVSNELDEYASQLLKDPNAVRTNGRLSAATINAYNRRMADLMNRSATEITAPSGKVVQFVAKRGEVGVHMALADRGYDMTQLKNGIWASGRVAYKKNSVDMV